MTKSPQTAERQVVGVWVCVWPQYWSLISAFSSPRSGVGQLTLQRHFFARLLQRLHRQVVSRLPEVVTVHRQDRVSHPQSPALVGGESREDLRDEDGHPVLPPPFDTDPQPARLLLDNPDFPHRLRGAVQADGVVAMPRPEAGARTPVTGTRASEVRVCAVIRVLSWAAHGAVVAVVLAPAATPAARAASAAASPHPVVLVLVVNLVLSAAGAPQRRSRLVSVRHAIPQARRRVAVVPVIAPVSANLRLGRQSERLPREFGSHSDPAVTEQKVQLAVLVGAGPNCHLRTVVVRLLRGGSRSNWTHPQLFSLFLHSERTSSGSGGGDYTTKAHWPASTLPLLPVRLNEGWVVRRGVEKKKKQTLKDSQKEGGEKRKEQLAAMGQAASEGLLSSSSPKAARLPLQRQH